MAEGATGTTEPHVPVLLQQVLEVMEPRAGAAFVDGTFGAGGYSAALLEAAECRVLAIDRDPDAIAMGAELVARFSGRLMLRSGTFGTLDQIAADAGVVPVDGVVLDIGVSSMQLDQAQRGFSFQRSGPLDMRMAQSGLSAADVVNELPEKDIADILFQYGEERRSRAIARAIVAARSQAPIETTQALVDLVVSVLGAPRADKIHPATRTFQALRVHVNDELGELVRGLLAAERILAPGGRLCVVTFHSLEDRIVKRFFNSRSQRKARASRHDPVAQIDNSEQFEQSPFQIVNHRPVQADEEEVNSNPRARSARLRWAVRTDGPTGPADDETLRALGLPRRGLPRRS